MKCKVCGAQSGKYPLCHACNVKKEKSEVIKCEKCGSWHLIYTPCPTHFISADTEDYLYNVKKTLISVNEQEFYNAIRSSVPNGYFVFPQVNLAAFIDRTDDSRYHNELFRNVDFLITDAEYTPKFIIEINDRTHLTNERKERDKKIQNICEEAGIPIISLWTSYGVNPEYIKKRIFETLEKLPVPRVHHFDKATIRQQDADNSRLSSKSKKGCYVATCVYGSYNCPEVWVLRRYRDNVLANRRVGRAFIKVYYALSPRLVKHFGKFSWFIKTCKTVLDKFVAKLQNSGFESSPYTDKD